MHVQHATRPMSLRKARRLAVTAEGKIAICDDLAASLAAVDRKRITWTEAHRLERMVQRRLALVAD